MQSSNSTKKEHQWCSQRVYSGERWDFSGHMCEKNAKHYEDGKWWCGLHAPSRVAARNATKGQKAAAEAAERRARIDEIDALVERLGIGRCNTYGHGTKFNAPAAGVKVSLEQLRALVKRLDGKTEQL